MIRNEHHAFNHLSIPSLSMVQPWRYTTRACGALQHTVFILSLEGRNLPLYLQMNPFAMLQIRCNNWQSKELNVYELYFCVMLTEMQLFEVSGRFNKENQIISEVKHVNEKCWEIIPFVVIWMKVLGAYLPRLWVLCVQMCLTEDDVAWVWV